VGLALLTQLLANNLDDDILDFAMFGDCSAALRFRIPENRVLFPLTRYFAAMTVQIFKQLNTLHTATCIGSVCSIE